MVIPVLVPARAAQFLRTYGSPTHAFLRTTTGIHLALGVGFGILAAFLLWPITGGDYPPGVDTPTFLHLSWVTDLALTGGLPNRLEDPFWYGGFSYLVYPPLSYGIVGLVTAVTPAGLVPVYTSVLILAYGALGFSTWFLAREFGLGWWPAALAGVFMLLAYPSLNSVFLWGWFTTVVSLPFALMSIAFLERSFQRESRKAAVVAGIFMALAILAHHMTGLSMTIGLFAWLAVHLVRGGGSRRAKLVFGLIAAVTAFILILPWAVPFLITTSDAGFRREIAGNWQFPLTTYATNVLDIDLVGDFIYPSYMGIVLAGMALVGAFLSLMEWKIEENRLIAVALMLALLLWFSLGATANPLISRYPMSGLDVARFHIFMTPFMALLAAFALERVTNALVQAIPSFQTPSLRAAVVAVASIVVLVYPVYIALQARDLVQPYQVEPQVSQALDWLETNTQDGEGPTGIYAVGFWNWQAFLIPTLTGRRIVDGWHDEGADNIQLVRQLRNMAWPLGEPVDAEIVHEILRELDGKFVVLYRSYWEGERTGEYRERLNERPDLFRRHPGWRDIDVFEVLPSPVT